MATASSEPAADRAAIALPIPRRAPSGMLWMALAAALFAVMNVLVRVSSSRVPWSEVAAVRASVGALVAVGVARARGVTLVIHDRRLSWMRSICGTCAMLCGFATMGSSRIALGDVVTLGSLSPIFVALLARPLLGERSGLRVWVATLIAFAGVALMVGPTFHLAGHLAAIAALGALFSALAMILLRKLGAGGSGAARESPEAIVAHFSLVAAAAMIAIALPALRMPDLEGALLLAATGVLGGLAQIAQTRAYALEKASRLGVVSYLGLVIVHALAPLVLGEAAGLHGLIGAALIVGAGLSLAIAAMRDARAAAPA